MGRTRFTDMFATTARRGATALLQRQTVCPVLRQGAALCTNPSPLGRFSDPWWRQFDQPTHGFRDSSGFVNRLPLRLESKELIVWGMADPEKMWSEFADEEFQPILVGGKAVVTVWINDFSDTDCGGSYLETWYNTFVSKKSEPQISLPLTPEAGLAIAAAQPTAQSFLQRVLCGDAPGNPGAALKAITGGREIFGFPKHPVPAQLSHTFRMNGDTPTGIDFHADHQGQRAITFSCVLPDTANGAVEVPLEVPMSAPDGQIGAPKHGGTHRGDNGAHQSLYATSVKCTQIIAPWDPSTDTLEIGENEHYAPISRWDFVPVAKAYSPDFKICAHKPSGWISGSEALEAHDEYEQQMVAGTLPGAL